MTASNPFARWPELLDGLNATDSIALREAVAANIHEGWDPTREDLALLAKKVKGEISEETYLTSVTVSTRKSSQ